MQGKVGEHRVMMVFVEIHANKQGFLFVHLQGGGSEEIYLGRDWVESVVKQTQCRSEAWECSTLPILQGMSSTCCHSGRLPVLVLGSQFHRTRLSRRIPASVLAYVAESQPSDTPSTSGRSITRQDYQRGKSPPSINTMISKEWPYRDWTSQGCGVYCFVCLVKCTSLYRR